MNEHQPVQNIDRELWRGPDEGNGSYYADSIHVTRDGGIGINVDGHVIVRPLRVWHAIAAATPLISLFENHYWDSLEHCKDIVLAHVRSIFKMHVDPAKAFSCGARRGTVGSNYPQDCNWPLCGCDAYADKVIAALQECGALPAARTTASAPNEPPSAGSGNGPHKS